MLMHNNSREEKNNTAKTQASQAQFNTARTLTIVGTKESQLFSFVYLFLGTCHQFRIFTSLFFTFRKLCFFFRSLTIYLYKCLL